MPTCLAVGCANTTGKTKVRKSYYRVPRPNSHFEMARANRWLINLQLGHSVDTFDFTKDKVVCEDHFHVDCYMSLAYISSSPPPDMRVRKRMLKDGSLPTIFPNYVYDVINMDGTMASGGSAMTIANYFARKRTTNGDKVQIDLPTFENSRSSPKKSLTTNSYSTSSFTATTRFISLGSTVKTTSSNGASSASNVDRVGKVPLSTTSLEQSLSFQLRPSQVSLPTLPQTTGLALYPTVLKNILPVTRLKTSLHASRSKTRLEAIGSLQTTTTTVYVTSSSPTCFQINDVCSLNDTLQPSTTQMEFNSSEAPLTNSFSAKQRTVSQNKPNSCQEIRHPITINLTSPSPINHNKSSSTFSSRNTTGLTISHMKPRFKRTNHKPIPNTRHVRQMEGYTPRVNDYTSCIMSPASDDLVCKLCTDNWNENRQACPMCMEKQRNSSCASAGEMMDDSLNDPKLKSQMRRNRIKLLFEDCQNELDFLEMRNEEIIHENENMKKENEELKKQLQEQETRYLDSLKTTSTLDQGELGNGTEGSDIKTILKLSNKLQETMTKNESLIKANATLKKDLKIQRNEKEKYLHEIKLMKEEKHVRARRNRFSVNTLRNKVDGYDREIQQWKKALKRSDNQIEELTASLENYKAYDGSYEQPSSQLHESSCHYRPSESRMHENNEAGCSKDTNPTVGTSASAMLLNFVNTISPVWKQWRKNSFEESSDTRLDQINTTIENYNNLSSPPVAVKSDFQVNDNSFPDLGRFPACRKIMELTKARQELVESGILSSRHSSRSSESPRSWNGSPHLPFSIREVNLTSRGASFSDAQLYNQQDENGDEITIVIPSSEYHQNADSGISSNENNVSTSSSGWSTHSVNEYLENGTSSRDGKQTDVHDNSNDVTTRNINGESTDKNHSKINDTSTHNENWTSPDESCHITNGPTSQLSSEIPSKEDKTNGTTLQNDDDDDDDYEESPTTSKSSTPPQSFPSISLSSISLSSDDVSDERNLNESRQMNSDKSIIQMIPKSRSPENYQPTMKKVKTETIY